LKCKSNADNSSGIPLRKKRSNRKIEKISPIGGGKNDKKGTVRRRRTEKIGVRSAPIRGKERGNKRRPGMSSWKTVKFASGERKAARPSFLVYREKGWFFQHEKGED